jgi:hypothetical protein
VQPRISNGSDQRLRDHILVKENSFTIEKPCNGQIRRVGCDDSPPKCPLYGVAVRSPWFWEASDEEIFLLLTVMAFHGSCSLAMAKEDKINCCVKANAQR